jgi:hypothetical protein
MGKAAFLDTVNRLVIDFWINSVERGVGTTLTLLALQLRQPWRDFVCGRFFDVTGLVSVGASSSISEHDDPLCDTGS